MICLDKTIDYSLRIINEKMKPSNEIGVNKFLGTMHEFYFQGSEDRCIPIEHIGLAELTYQEAIDSFYFKKINKDNSLSKHFEPLPKDTHIADCLRTFNPDTLGWYVNNNGKEIKFTDCIKGLVYKTDLTKCMKVFDNEQVDSFAPVYRIQTVQDALDSAISLYGVELLKNNCVNTMFEVDEQLNVERDIAQIRLNELINKTFENFNENEEINNQPNDLEQ